MDLTPFLEAALSAENNIRQEAEAKLKLARDQNLALFLVMLVLIMANEAKPKDARHMAGIILKNELKGKSEERSRLLAEQWNKIAGPLQQKIRQQVLTTLHSKFYEVRKIASRVLAAIASIDLYQNRWCEVVGILQKNVTHGKSPEGVESSLMAMGYLCEGCDARFLHQQSNLILTAVFHGMRNAKNFHIKLAGTEALFNAMEYAESNLQNKEHRDFIMKCLLENSVCKDKRVRKAALECIIQIVYRYYQIIGFYIEHLSKVTIKLAMEDLEEVAMQAIEFWSTLAETEAEIIQEEEEARDTNRPAKRKCFFFVKKVLPQLSHVLTTQLLKQTEELDAWTISTAAGTCLSLVSHVVGDSIVKHVINFIIQNINHAQDWKRREAATLAFSAIVDGPKSENMTKLVGMALPNLINHTKDQVPLVKDTSVFCIGRIAKFQPSPLINNFLDQSLKALLACMKDSPQIAEKACWALLHVAKCFEQEEGKENPTSKLSQYFQPLCENVLTVTQRPDVETGNLRINAYECLTSLVQVSTPDCSEYLNQRIAGVLIQKLYDSIKKMTPQNKDEIWTLQGLLCGALEHVTEKLGPKMSRFADNLMRAYLTILKSDNASVQQEVLMAISSLATALGENFVRYMDSFRPFLLRGLKDQKADDVCVAAVWCTVDVIYAIRKKMVPFMDDIVRVLLTNLQSSDISRDVKPLIISCLGDVAMGIGADFQKYVLHIAAVLKNAAQADVNRNDEDMVDYLNTLREHIFDAFIGILQGVKKENFNIFNPFVKPLIEFVGRVYKDKQSDQDVIIKACSSIGDLVNVYGPKCKDYISFPFIKSLIQECSNSPDRETKRVAIWVKKQIQKRIQ